MKNTSLVAEFRYRRIKMLLTHHSTSIIKRGQHRTPHLTTISSRGHYQYPRRTLRQGTVNAIALVAGSLELFGFLFGPRFERSYPPQETVHHVCVAVKMSFQL